MIFVVTDKATGAELSRYAAAQPTEASGFSLADFDHTEIVEQDTTEAPATVYGGRRLLSKIEFRRMFNDVERPLIDEFNATFETHPALTDEQKRGVRSGLEDYKATETVNLDDVSTAMMLGLYTMLGLIDAARAQEIMNG